MKQDSIQLYFNKIEQLVARCASTQSTQSLTIKNNGCIIFIRLMPINTLENDDLQFHCSLTFATSEECYDKETKTITNKDIKIQKGFICNDNTILDAELLYYDELLYFLETLSSGFKTTIFFLDDSGSPQYSMINGHLFSVSFRSPTRIDYPKQKSTLSLGEQVGEILSYLKDKLARNEITQEAFSPFVKLWDGIKSGAIKEVPSNLLNPLNNYVREKRIEEYKKIKSESLKSSHSFSSR